VQIHRVHRKTVEGVGGHGDYVALAQAGDDVVDPVRLGFIGMDAQDLRGQEGLPQFPKCRYRKDGSYHSTSLGASWTGALGLFAVLQNSLKSAVAHKGFPTDASSHCTE
jgi:hypothetical protein